MGTRSLIAVILDEKPVVANYCQYDGYPSGQGTGVFEFIRSSDINEFSKRCRELRFATKDEVESLEIELSSKILNDILDGKHKVLQNSFNFGYDSLFCEWAYIIDLDNSVVECYSGFNTIPNRIGDRFFSEYPNSSGYFGVRLMKKYKFSDLNDIPYICEELNYISDNHHLRYRVFETIDKFYKNE